MFIFISQALKVTMSQTFITYTFDGQVILVVRSNDTRVHQRQNNDTIFIGPVVSSEEPRFVVAKPEWKTTNSSKDCIFKASLRSSKRFVVRRIVVSNNQVVHSETAVDIRTPNLTIMMQKLDLDSGSIYNYTVHIIRSFTVSSHKRLYILKNGSIMTSLPENTEAVDCEVNAAEGDWYTHTYKYYDIFPKESSQSTQHSDIVPMDLPELDSFNLYASLVFIHCGYKFSQINWCKIDNFDVRSIRAESDSYGLRNYSSVVYVGYSKADTAMRIVVGIISGSPQNLPQLLP